MTRYLVLADIHANLEALEAVLHDAPPYDAVLFLGDLIGYGPNPNECVATVRQLPDTTMLLGNHDLAALGQLDLSTFNPVARAAAEWTASALTKSSRRILEPLTSRLDAPDVTLVHASPCDPVWEYVQEAWQGPPNFAAFSGSLCLLGHTHVPRILSESSAVESEVIQPVHGDVVHIGERRMMVNPGSVGQPRDGDPRAAYALLDSDARTVTFRRVYYPYGTTQDKIAAAGLPASLASRLEYGI